MIEFRGVKFFQAINRVTLYQVMMSQKKRFSFISISFAIDFLFKIGFPSDASNF